MKIRTMICGFAALAVSCAGAVLGPHGVPTVQAAAVPPGLPSHFGIGLAGGPNSNGIDGWMPNSGIPWDYAYQYLSGGVNTGSDWESWNANGQFPLSYARDAASHGYIPVFSYYELLQSNGSCGSCGEAQKDLSNLNNTSVMATYFQNFALLMQRLGSGTYGGIAGYGKTAIVHVEPDLGGYAEHAVLNNANCYGYCTGQGNNPSYLNAAVASSGVAAVSGYPNTYQGFNWALLHLRDLYAPNVLLAFHINSWATGTDIATNTSSTIDATSLGQEAGSFAAQSGISGVPSGTSSYDLLFNDVSDRDAGYYKYVLNNPSTWWDRTNTTFPNFHRWESYIGAASQAAGRSVIVWQIPEGNQYFDTDNNTDGHYQDNRAEYFFNHISELAHNGIIGLLFGAGNGGSTQNADVKNDGITNPSSFCTSDGVGNGTQICNSHTSTVSDDDGGYIRMQGQQYFANGGYPLTSSTTASPTATPSGSATATPTSTATPTATATSTPTTTTTLFADTFESDPIGSTPSGWTVAGGTWTVKQGSGSNSSHVVSQTNSTITTPVELVAGGSSWTNYSVQADIQAPASTNSITLAARRQDTNNNYQFLLKNGNEWDLGGRQGGSWFTLGSGSFSYSAGNWYTLTLTVKGTTISGAINGQTVVTATDSRFSSGGISLRTTTTPSFDNVRVTSL